MAAKIYTKGGDSGQTGLFGGQRVSKDDPRVEAYGSIDELNALLGLVRSADPFDPLGERLARIQSELFTLGAQLAAPDAEQNPRVPKVNPAWATALEREIDEADAQLAPLRRFILPGGAPVAAGLHVARAVCRRAERAVVALAPSATLDPSILVYLNRLSDWLFTMARLANHRAGMSERPWTPSGER